MRSFRTHVALLVGGALLVLWGSSVDWITWRVVDPIAIQARPGGASGTALDPGLRAAAFLALAAVPALFALRGRGRRIVGIAVGVGAAALAAGATFGAMAERRRPVLQELIPDASCVPACVQDRMGPQLGPALVLLGALLLLLAGITAVRARGWPGLGSSYAAPGGTAAPSVTDKAVWDALDRGDDPTA